MNALDVLIWALVVFVVTMTLLVLTLGVIAIYRWITGE